MSAQGTATGVAGSHQPREVQSPVVVTGAAGFIGRHLVRALTARGGVVRCVDLPEALATWPSGTARGGGPGRVERHGVDVRDQEGLARLLEGADVAFHLASAHLAHGAPEAWFREVNVEGTRNVVRAAARGGVRRVVHVSSVGVYGHVSDPPADEEAPKHPSNPYERTKLEGEAAALEEGAAAGIEVIVLRPAWVYGPGCPRTEKLLRAVRRGRFFYAGDGSNLRHPIWIGDTVEALLLAGAAPSTATGRPWLAVGPRAVTVRELVESCARVQGVRAPRLRFPRGVVRAALAGVEAGAALLGREPPVSRRSLAFFEHDNAFSGEGAATAFGFRAGVDLEEGLRRTVASVEGRD
jgi:dihydroflavonol-4-reductase